MEKVEDAKDNMLKREQYETERLCIRHFATADVDSCYKGWGRDEQLGKFILGYPMTKETMKSFVMTMEKNENAWVIAERKSGQCIGYITVDIPYLQLAIGEIGYVIGGNFQRKGYAYEAVSKLLHIYFEEKSLYMMEAKYNIYNVSSEKLLKKLGFVTDGILRNRRNDLQTGQRCDLVVCSLCRDDCLPDKNRKYTK